MAVGCCASTFSGAEVDAGALAGTHGGAFSAIVRCSARETAAWALVAPSAKRIVARGFGLRELRALSAGLRAVIFGELIRRKEGGGGGGGGRTPEASTEKKSVTS